MPKLKRTSELGDTCADCDYIVGTKCHRYPPPWPSVTKTSGWCGEFTSLYQADVDEKEPT